MQIKDKVYVVTGAGGGIGGELVKSILKRGGKVAAIDLRQDGLDKLKSSLGNPEDLSLHSVDISKREEVELLPKEIEKHLGDVDGLINCAGIIQPFIKINDLDYQAIERVMNVNFYGTLYMTQTFLPDLLKRDEAHIINVSSMGGFLPVPGQGIYGASKAAVKLMTESLYAELLNTKVHVSVVFPGATKTDITNNSGVAMPNISEADVKKQSKMMLQADEAAEIIIKGIVKNKPQIYTGRDSRLMNKLYRLAPVRATKLITKQMGNLLK